MTALTKERDANENSFDPCAHLMNPDDDRPAVKDPPDGIVDGYNYQLFYGGTCQSLSAPTEKKTGRARIVNFGKPKVAFTLVEGSKEQEKLKDGSTVYIKTHDD